MRLLPFRSRFFLLIIISWTLCLCSCNSLNGKTEIRQGKTYLVNSSKTKRYNFTVRRTEITNDSIYTYTTEIISLAPGDERLLGIVDSISKIVYPTRSTQVVTTYDFDYSKTQINNSKNKKNGSVDDLIEELYPLEKQLDTIINGKKMKYRFSNKTFLDTLHPLQQDTYKYKFEITGESYIK